MSFQGIAFIYFHMFSCVFIENYSHLRYSMSFGPQPEIVRMFVPNFALCVAQENRILQLSDEDSTGQLPEADEKTSRENDPNAEMVRSTFEGEATWVFLETIRLWVRLLRDNRWSKFVSSFEVARSSKPSWESRLSLEDVASLTMIRPFSGENWLGKRWKTE